MDRTAARLLRGAQERPSVTGGPLSVIGSLEDLSFADILQVIHVSRQSGTLVLSGRDGVRRGPDRVLS